MADLLPEKWMKAMAVTTTVLGVAASIGSSRSSFYITKAQQYTALEGSQWAYYQAKSIKQDLFLTQIKALEVQIAGATTPAQKDLLEQTIQNTSRDIARYDQEKADIKKEAEKINKENALLGTRGSQFSLSIVFAQIGIMLSSVGLLLKREKLWYVGLVMGVISLFFLANGFLLFLK